ncbi:MAG TPA: orotidine-5'-phosphate decarboxylase [Gemmatimonadales bacterium]|nr:orotidine-5'-phosphate decarboxylase [Gemmatimonadales bacterium]
MTEPRLPPAPAAVAARDRLIVALDLDTPSENEALVRHLGAAASFYKVGWISLAAGGFALVPALIEQGKQVFLDLKIFDVPNTVRQSIAAVARLGVRFVTVHGNRAIVEAAVSGRGGSALEILAVTVLTSLTGDDAREMYGLPDGTTLDDHVVSVTRSLVALGADGVIASAEEVARLRAAVPARTTIVTPGIRLAGEATHDQRRVGAPDDAIAAGADYLVVGRSIYRNADPIAQVERYVDAIERGLAARERGARGPGERPASRPQP